MEVLTFEEAGHVYRLDGRRLPSVTQILGQFQMSGDVSRFTAYHRERGKATHLATQLDDLNRLDEDSLDMRLIPKVRAWRGWRRMTGFTPLADGVELMVWSMFGYAGTIDRVGVLDGRLSIVDIKGDWLPDTTALQTAAYARAYFERTGVLIEKRYGVSLAVDGTFRSEEFNDRNDLKVFLGLVQAYYWKQRHGLIERR